MNSWLEPLIDPHELAVAAQRGNRDPRAGLALLLYGQLFIYERLAVDYQWPRLGSRPRKSAPRGEQLLAAVGLHLTGGRGASAAYDALATPTGRDTSFRTAVAVLRSLYLSDQDEDEQATAVLREALTFSVAPVERMLLELHIGAREAERGDLGAAIEATESARKARPQPGTRKHHRALKTIAQYNLFNYRWQVGEFIDSSRLPLRGSELPLVRGAIDISIGLAKYLEDQFDQATRDPYARSIAWRAADPVEMPLLGALVRAECLADWAEQRSTRTLLGRYYVASKLGTSEGVAQQAFVLLRRAGDYKGVQAAARSVAAIGPLGALRAETVAVLRRPWPRAEAAAILALISGGADLLQPKEADRAVARLRSTPEIVANNAPEGLRALARVVRVASDRAQNAGSRFARTLAAERSEPLVLQTLGQVVEALRWEVVSGPERKRWITYIESYLSDEGDARFLAERAAGPLARVEREAVAQILIRAYETRPNIGLLALLTDADVALPRKLRSAALDEVDRALRKIREEAQSGSYGFGGIDPALLMLSLIRRTPKTEYWDTLVEFLLDEHVGIDAKTRTLDQLASPAISIPNRVQVRLRENVESVTGFVDGLGASPASLRGSTLRLWLRLGGVGRDELLSRLLELAGDLDIEARREAALTLPAARRRLGDDAAFTLGLGLTRDRDFSVRAAAARSLARLRSERAGELGSLASRRLESLLAEPGTDVPYQTLAGLVESQREGQQHHEGVLDEVARVHRSHASRRVQELAALLLREVGVRR